MTIRRTPLEDDFLMKLLTGIAITGFKKRLDPVTAKAILPTIRLHYADVATFPLTPAVLKKIIARIQSFKKLGTQIVHASYLRYYYSTHLAHDALSEYLGRAPTFADFPQPSYFLMPINETLLRPLSALIVNIRGDNELEREKKPKTTLTFKEIKKALKVAYKDTLSPPPGRKVYNLSTLNAYLILLLSFYGPPPRSAEIARIEVYDEDPQTGNILVPTPAGCTLTLRIHKNSGHEGNSAKPVILDYPHIVWDEIVRIRSLVPAKYLTPYLLSGRKPPISKKQIADVTAQYLRVPDHIKSDRYAYTNRDIRQAYALGNLNSDPNKLMHTQRTHILDYLPSSARINLKK